MVSQCVQSLEKARKYAFLRNSGVIICAKIRRCRCKGAYKKGSNREVDEAIFYYPKIEAFLSQGKQERFSLEQCYELLGNILAIPYTMEV